MKLTTRLLGYLNRVFNKQPMQFLAVSISYDGGLTWDISDGILTTSVSGGIGSDLSIDLSGYTLLSLVQFIAAQPGYVTTYLADGQQSLSALVLIDSSGDISESGGGDLYGYTSTLWSYMEANAKELTDAAATINTLPAEMSTTTADTIWLDTLGNYYNVKRNLGELDAAYGPRIIATVIRPAANNIALEMAIQAYTGQDATVTDVVLKGVTGATYNAAHEHNGAIEHNANATDLYGLFDVSYAYDLINGGDYTAFQKTVTALVNLLRAAGTHMRSLTLSGSVLTDTLTRPKDTLTLNVGVSIADALTPPTDAIPKLTARMAPLTDTLNQPTDAATMSVTYNYQYSGKRSYNGAIKHSGGLTIAETLA